MATILKFIEVISLYFQSSIPSTPNYFREKCMSLTSNVSSENLLSKKCNTWTKLGCFQAFWVGMTTNERLNLSRYTHMFNDMGQPQSPYR